MESSTLYIHIGTYKTGSSTIQKVIRGSSSLKKENISDIGRPLFTREIGTAETIKKEFITNNQREISKRIRRERFFGNNKFIISSEHFSGNQYVGLKNSAIVAKILEKITDSLDVNVRIIVYLRRQDEFVQSLYTQEIHQGGSMQFEQFMSGFNENSFDWYRLINNYADCFGEDNIIVRRYGKKYLPNHNSIVRDFGEIIGSEELKKYSKATKVNRGYSRDALEIARHCNQFLEPNEKKNLRRLLQSISSKQAFKNYDYFDVKERLKFLGRYEESNSEVAKKYFNETNLFEKPRMVNSSKLYKGLNNDIILDHLVKIIKEIKPSQGAKNETKLKFKANQIKDIIFSSFPSLKENIKILLGRYY